MSFVYSVKLEPQKLVKARARAWEQSFLAN